MRGPTSLLETDIRFEDALEEYRELLYEYFRHWEVFESFIRMQLRDKPGQNKIVEGIVTFSTSKTKGLSAVNRIGRVLSGGIRQYLCPLARLSSSENMDIVHDRAV
ncbi:hypothetical protein N7G274_004132 [Stereocaulon virgatum]|uniref:Ubiquitin-like domain-containing protein n=1 Tax=Stereocaulon virgatum TaxID=373712 RepID=A0ABR4AB29_9LECA